ncbi:MSHA biogenesis protein MshJ [Marinobacter sp. TBZ242]|uniref:MSHA biogenesis protein MshJ n=1 Tax=Marinobacter azerbaijanicus TaxID=3050455 RepID=A0ABT7IGK9_9GAMM|nr:MSHA biogenesis protein MshJ [Marinobacter sp. TBZ242]MDL0433301.1 MSHA biogenesis protein MshJ [Marinobacter sp. TBZ242]
MTPAFRQQLDRGTEWFNGRPVRERLLLVVTAVVVILFAGWELAVAPVKAANEQLRFRQIALSDTRASLTEEQEVLTAQLASDPSQVLREQLAAREQRLDRLNRELAETTGRLIAPRAMVGLLRDMLTAQGKLELLGLELMAPVAVFESEPDDTGDQAGGGQAAEPLLFAHDAEIAVRGDYMDVLAYLETLEAMDARLGWVLLEYDSSDYPDNEVRIRVRTLSLDRAWLGV